MTEKKHKDVHILIEVAVSSNSKMFIYLNTLVWTIEEQINLAIICYIFFEICAYDAFGFNFEG